MKKFGLIAIMIALVMAFSQCKKDDTTTPTNVGEKVFVTLKVGNGSKVAVEPETGKVTFEHGDVIHVASNGIYVGTLAYDNDLSRFSGNITEPTEGEKLHFYFLGNQTPEFNSGNSECSVIISDQTAKLPVISYNTSRENYQVGKTDYSATLLNKCALVKFNVTTPSNSPICITGMHNKVTVDFSENTVTPSMDGEGIIKLPAGAGENVEKWAILLPQEVLGEGEEGTVYSEDGSYTGTRPTMSKISENDYLANGIDVTVNTVPVAGVPEGAINGLFTINEDGDQVYFSQGNLQYQATTNTWRFAENQWDYVGCTDVFHVYGGSASGTIDGSSNHLISPNYNGWIDYFGWGTSGWNNGNIYYHPYDSDSNDNSQDQGWGYGPTDGINYDYNLTGLFANSDWGIWNPIINGGNQLGFWRTLSCDEFLYLLNGRNTSSGMYYVKALVNSINGMIILPDNWSANNYPLNNPNQNNVSFTNNIISSSIWASVFENNGAVFLPAAGHRNGIIAYYPGDVGGYWLSTCYDNSNASHYYFNDTQATVYIEVYKYQGHSVRLIHDYNP